MIRFLLTKVPYILAVAYTVLILAAVLICAGNLLTGNIVSDFLSTRTAAFGLTLLGLACGVVTLQIIHSRFGSRSWLDC